MSERSWSVLTQTLLVAALIMLPLFYTLVPPLEDYPNHLARMFVLANLPDNHQLAHFYQTEWAPIPNLIMDLIVPPLIRWAGVYTAGKIFIGLTLLLLLLGPMTLHRTLYGRWSAWPLVGGLFVYNGFLFVGLMNYLFGVGVAVFGLATWITLSKTPGVGRLIASLAFCATLYVCHLVALGVYGLTIASFEAWRVYQSRSMRPIDFVTSAGALALPFLPFVYLLLHSPTWSLAHANVWESQGKLEAVSLFLSVYSDLADIPFLIVIVLSIGAAIQRGLVRFHPAGLIQAGVITLVFLAMPRQAFGSWMADQRLVVALFFLTLGFISIDLRKLENQNAFFALCLVVIAFRVVDVSVNWAALSQPLLELKSSLSVMAPGSRLLVTQIDNLPDGARNSALSHAPNLAIIERSALVSRLFVVPGKQILHARDGYQQHVDTEDGDTPTISQAILTARTSLLAGSNPRYLKGWPGFYDYLVVLGADMNEAQNPASDLLRRISGGHGFTLYKIQRAENP